MKFKEETGQEELQKRNEERTGHGSGGLGSKGIMVSC